MLRLYSNNLVKHMYQEEGISIYLGDSMEIAPLIIQENSVDLIFTDPPYLKKYLYLYDWLGAEAARIIKINKLCFTYATPYWKYEVYKKMTKYMTYYYEFVVKHNGKNSIYWPLKINFNYKIILSFQKRERRKRQNEFNIFGLIESAKSDKRYHPWGQNKDPFVYYIMHFTQPGDLVVDPFLGGGTTAAVCKALGRRCIGIEIDPEAYKTSVGRIRRQRIPQNGAQLCLV